MRFEDLIKLTISSVLIFGDLYSAPLIEYIFVESLMVPSISSTPKESESWAIDLPNAGQYSFM
jgi:hypothetical protein